MANGKRLIYILITMAVTGFPLYYILVTKHKGNAIVSALTNPNVKHYEVEISVEVEGSKLSQTKDERGKTLDRIDAVLCKRIDLSGGTLTHKDISIEKGSLSYVVSDVVDTNALAWLFSRQGKLEFYDTWENRELLSSLEDINKKLEENNGKNTLQSANGADISKQTASLFKVLFPNLEPNRGAIEGGGPAQGPIVGMSFLKDTAKVNEYLNLPGISSLLPRGVYLLWGANPANKEKTVLFLYAIKRPPYMTEAPLTGKAVTDAFNAYEENGNPEVEITLNADAAPKWERMTEAAANSQVNGIPVKRCIAIVLDNKVFSAPRVSQKIIGGRMQITGVENAAAAANLANIIKSGETEAPVLVKSYKVK